jgi:hypothetical protein
MNKLVILISVLLFVGCRNNNSGCGRDKGDYEIEGVILDACTKEPLKGAQLSAQIYYEVDTATTDSSGYFHLSASWDLERGIFSKQTDVILSLRYFDDSLQGDVDALFIMPRGYSNMGAIMNAYVQLPLKFEVDSSTCTNCRWDILVSQNNGWGDMYPNSMRLHNVPTTSINISEFMVVSWDTINQKPTSPIMLSITEIDSTNKHSEKPALDVSSKLTLCGFSDTLLIKL